MDNTPLKYQLTNESVTVIWQGKPYTVQKGAPNYINLRKAIFEEAWSSVPNYLSIPKSFEEWAKGDFTFNATTEKFSYKGEELPVDINRRIIAMATAGEDPRPLQRFYERLQKNPSMRSVQQLYPFLAHEGISITEDGCFLAYKGVRRDYKDAHSGTFDNSPGKIHEMPRNKISDDPQHACHEGFHVGAIGYAGGFSERVIVCKVDPENVVCVPYDSKQQKMRVCKYEVIGNYGETLPSTTFTEDTPPPEPEPTEEEQAEEEDREAYAEQQAAQAEEDGLEEEKEEAEDEEPRTESTKPNLEVVKDTEEKSEKTPTKDKKDILTLLAGMGMDELMKQSIDSLRAYATYGLKIVGASKIAGGKPALVAKILEFRSKQ